MAKYTIKSQSVEKTLSIGKIRQFMKDHPNSEIGFVNHKLSGMPAYLIEDIVRHNSKFNPTVR